MKTHKLLLGKTVDTKFKNKLMQEKHPHPGMPATTGALLPVGSQHGKGGKKTDLPCTPATTGALAFFK